MARRPVALRLGRAARQRLDRPYIRENGKLRPRLARGAVGGGRGDEGARKVAGLVGDLAPVEAAYALKQLVEGLGGAVECRTDGAKLPAGNRAGYVGTAAIEDIDTAARILLVGTNPRAEAPVLNARIRKAWTRGAEVALIGEAVDLTYDYAHLGHDRAALAKALADAKPETGGVVIVGQVALRGSDGEAVLGHAMEIAQRTGAGLLVLHVAARAWGRWTWAR
jgi:NADH-quinone oxidoreductase subunit G